MSRFRTATGRDEGKAWEMEQHRAESASERGSYEEACSGEPQGRNGTQTLSDRKRSEAGPEINLLGAVDQVGTGSTEAESLKGCEKAGMERDTLFQMRLLAIAGKKIYVHHKKADKAKIYAWWPLVEQIAGDCRERANDHHSEVAPYSRGTHQDRATALS